MLNSFAFYLRFKREIINKLAPNYEFIKVLGEFPDTDVLRKKKAVP
jgi:hypothetical protein